MQNLKKEVKLEEKRQRKEGLTKEKKRDVPLPPGFRRKKRDVPLPPGFRRWKREVSFSRWKREVSFSRWVYGGKKTYIEKRGT